MPDGTLDKGCICGFAIAYGGEVSHIQMRATLQQADRFVGTFHCNVRNFGETSPKDFVELCGFNSGNVSPAVFFADSNRPLDVRLSVAFDVAQPLEAGNGPIELLGK